MKSLLSLFAFCLGCSTVSANELQVGSQAPNFNLQATTGDYYQLEHYRDKQVVVIAWYPMANTRGCTIECKSIVEKGHLIREFDVSYFMASIDPLDDNRDFAEKTNADFPMLSDPSKDVARAYGVLNMLGVASRVTFYIDRTGDILKIDRSIKPATAAEDIARTLAELNVSKR